MLWPRKVSTIYLLFFKHPAKKLRIKSCQISHSGSKRLVIFFKFHFWFFFSLFMFCFRFLLFCFGYLGLSVGFFLGGGGGIKSIINQAYLRRYKHLIMRKTTM